MTATSCSLDIANNTSYLPIQPILEPPFLGSSLRRRLATGATLMLNLLPVRLRRRESVSLGRFRNCNQPGMNNFRRHGVEDEPEPQSRPGDAVRGDRSDAARDG